MPLAGEKLGPTLLLDCCPACGHSPISKKAESCGECGHPIQPKTAEAWARILIPVAALGVSVLAFLLSKSHNETDDKRASDALVIDTLKLFGSSEKRDHVLAVSLLERAIDQKQFPENFLIPLLTLMGKENVGGSYLQGLATHFDQSLTSRAMERAETYPWVALGLFKVINRLKYLNEKEKIHLIALAQNAAFELKKSPSDLTKAEDGYVTSITQTAAQPILIAENVSPPIPAVANPPAKPRPPTSTFWTQMIDLDTEDANGVRTSSVPFVRLPLDEIQSQKIKYWSLVVVRDTKKLRVNYAMMSGAAAKSERYGISQYLAKKLDLPSTREWREYLTAGEVTFQVSMGDPIPKSTPAAEIEAKGRELQTAAWRPVLLRHAADQAKDAGEWKEKLSAMDAKRELKGFNVLAPVVDEQPPEVPEIRYFNKEDVGSAWDVWLRLLDSDPARFASAKLSYRTGDASAPDYIEVRLGQPLIEISDSGKN